ncbi:hypothetical protein BH10BAC3_BH10BAC3_15230 [soil metagenome]
MRNSVTSIVLLRLLPSFYFAINLFKQQQLSQSVSMFVDKNLLTKEIPSFTKKTYYNSRPRKIELAFLSRQFSNKKLNTYNRKLKEYDFSNTIITIKQSTNLQNLKNDILN